MSATRRWRRPAIEQFDEIAPARYPYLQNVQTDKATIMWATLERGTGSVQYTADGTNFRTVTAQRQPFTRAQTGLTADYFQYQADLTDLNPGTYSYQCFVGGVPVTLAEVLAGAQEKRR